MKNSKFETSLLTASKIVTERKREEPALRFRIETCVDKTHVKVYEISNNKIVAAYTCDEEVSVVERDRGGNENE